MSAVESIDTILKRVTNGSEVTELNRIRDDHVSALDSLKPFMLSDVSDQESLSGPWSAFAKSFTGGASLFGDKAALKALKIGEEHGVNEYQEFLKNEELGPEVRELVQNRILPKQKEHLAVISRYLN